MDGFMQSRDSSEAGPRIPNKRQLSIKHAVVSETMFYKALFFRGHGNGSSTGMRATGIRLAIPTYITIFLTSGERKLCSVGNQTRGAQEKKTLYAVLTHPPQVQGHDASHKRCGAAKSESLVHGAYCYHRGPIHLRCFWRS